MFDLSAPLFVFKFVFLAEILVAEALNVYRLKRRPRFILRLVLSLVVLTALTFAMPILYYNSLYSSILFLIIFSITIIALFVCFDEPLGNIVYCAFFAYNEQHISFQIYTIICMFLNIDSNNNIYGQVMGDTSNGLQVLVFIMSHIIVYLACWTFREFRHAKSRDGKFHIKNIRVLIWVISIVLINIVLNSVVVYSVPEDIGNTVNTVICLYSIFSCIISIIMLVSIVGEEGLKSEVEVLEQMLHKNEKIFELSKTNIDFINMRCHDLRHRLRNALEKGVPDESELKEITHAIDIYDSILETGNEALDVILSEESIFCAQNNIKLICNIDGKQLAFLNRSDIYSLFQNGIHNAIDAVLLNDNSEQRIIRISVQRKKNMVAIHMENYLTPNNIPEFKDGLPISANGGNGLHGFGMRSMKMLTEKYGGHMCASIIDNIFNLDIIIPIPDNPACPQPI